MASNAARSRYSPKPQLVIFDKDGTLIDFDFMWSTWVEKLADDLHSLTGAKMHASIFEKLGYIPEKRTVVSKGKLCCSPMGHIRDIVKEEIKAAVKIHEHEAEAILLKSFATPSPDHTNVRPLTNLHDLFSKLKNDLGLKIAVCTTDDREPTIATLQLQGVYDMVDVVVGGNDSHIPSKPSPEQIYHICKQVGAVPETTIMVGDTSTDMTMGRAANVALNVGIMYGASSVADLQPNADILLPSLANLEKVMYRICS